MSAFLWVLREGGARDVPSLYHFRQVQTALRKSLGVPTVQNKSPKGNIYSMNDPRILVAMVSKSGHFYHLWSEYVFYMLGLGQSVNMRPYPSLSSNSKRWSHF